MLGPQDVGHRVVVRRIVGVRGNRPLFSDALGELVEYDASGVTIATRRGLERIGHDTIQAAKRVPRSRKEVAELERIASLAWPAPEVEALGGWTLRAAQGWTGRANSALPIGDPGLDRPAAIDAVVRWYADRGLPARMNVPLPVCATLDAALDARGWARSPTSLVLTAPLAAVLAAAPERPDLPPVRLDRAPDDAWLAVVAARKGALPTAAHHVLTAARLLRCASVERDLAVARGAVVDGYLHLSLLEVAESARRHGLAQHVTRALAQWGVEEGAGTAFLQVEQSNSAAVALYGRLGFTTHHEYVTRTAPG
ncbi:MAG: GNAT family N-acetyltransferase [Actinobacteria bacterium 13_2_20CM_2_71_6]|nr:MAG: GNAT family N-acetyltransferase [Actinobacteria bacterium 13_2_20CM_2_71_6]